MPRTVPARPQARVAARLRNCNGSDLELVALAREFHALTNARVIRGRRLCLPGWTATLPLGVDTLRATRSYAQRNIAHCVPLTSTSCGSPGGLILGTADPGVTLADYPHRVKIPRAADDRAVAVRESSRHEQLEDVDRHRRFAR